MTTRTISSTSAHTPDLAQLEATLRSQRSALQGDLRQHLGGESRAEHAREVLLQDGDDAPQRDADREVDFARSDRDTLLLAQIDAALQRLADGDYGLCTDCGEAIAAARLQLSPQAPRCVACETELERGQPRPATL
jgi:DnaK suppressor protein